MNKLSNDFTKHITPITNFLCDVCQITPPEIVKEKGSGKFYAQIIDISPIFPDLSVLATCTPLVYYMGEKFREDDEEDLLKLVEKLRFQIGRLLLLLLFVDDRSLKEIDKKDRKSVV